MEPWSSWAVRDTITGSIVLRVVQGSMDSVSGANSQGELDKLLGWIRRSESSGATPSPTRCLEKATVQRSLPFFPGPQQISVKFSPHWLMCHIPPKQEFCQLHRFPNVPSTPPDLRGRKGMSLSSSGTLVKSLCLWASVSFLENGEWLSFPGCSYHPSADTAHSTSKEPGAQGVRSSPAASSQ